MQSKIAEIDLNAEDISLKVQNILDNGVDKVVTETGAALDADGFAESFRNAPGSRRGRLNGC